MILSIKNLVKRHGSGFALEIDNLEIKTGMIYGLVGPNGAGKSTLLNILSLLEQPTEGAVFFQDTKVTGSAVLAVRRRICLVMEDPYLFQTTVAKNLTSGLSCRFVDKKLWPQMVHDTLQMVGLEGFQKRYAPSLSRGESQRVAIARALILKPEILFLDEPFTNIDKKHVSMLENLIKTINHAAMENAATHKTTVVFSTHDLSQACVLSNEVISLVDGKIINGSLDNLFKGTTAYKDGSPFVLISPKIAISVVTEKKGTVMISIQPRDIILSFKAISSSARNSFKGRVIKIEMMGQTVEVSIKIDEHITFVALITTSSHKHMQITIDSDIFVIFKSTSVMVF